MLVIYSWELLLFYLWDIANENLPEKYSSTEEYVKVLKEINGLSSDKIYSGENLMIMYMTE